MQDFLGNTMDTVNTRKQPVASRHIRFLDDEDDRGPTGDESYDSNFGGTNGRGGSAWKSNRSDSACNTEQSVQQMRSLFNAFLSAECGHVLSAAMRALLKDLNHSQEAGEGRGGRW